ncbi:MULTISPECIES: DUF2267 domain-containing protein [unclassified Roseitalea]|uniref:DUF2267 domain-containing protein n=1 Tax=unclassified Roseitalea TaxID=2639107 RepID=UPI00273DD57E|nr:MULTISPECIES: DUF2267 domain-containing protein [unclassified Roseitalea]
MPMPQDYQIAQQAFDALIADARDRLGLATRNQSYTVLQAVLTVFRRRLTPAQILIFADALPALTRAIFVAGWHEGEHRAGFGSRTALEAEVRDLRRHHNFAPEGSIRIIAGVLRRHADADRLAAALAALPERARRYWDA